MKRQQDETPEGPLNKSSFHLWGEEKSGSSTRTWTFGQGKAKKGCSKPAKARDGSGKMGKRKSVVTVENKPKKKVPTTTENAREAKRVSRVQNYDR